MIPSAFVMMDALPLNPNGKLDRRALPAPELAGLDLTGTLVAPRDAIELALVRVWEDVLGTRPIGIKHSFFELGGHSLLAVRLMARIEQELGQPLLAATLFHNPTIEHLAAVLRQHSASVPFSALVPLQAGNPDQPPLFLVHPVGGSVFCYVPLVSYFPPDRPVYGLQARGLDGRLPPQTDEGF